MNKYISYLGTVILLLLAGYLYDKFKIRELQDENLNDYKLVEKYLITDYIDNKNIENPSLFHNNKPIIWIHLNYKINAREWLSFGSRTSEHLNQPYLFYTLKSIHETCGRDFNICLIQDNDFKDLIPDWNIDMNRIGEPLKEKIRELAIAKILYIYGGLRVPISFFCMRNLYYIYNDIVVKNDKILIGELINKNVSSLYLEYFPCSSFIGCEKNNKTIERYIHYLETIISNDYTDESIFLGSNDKWLYEEIRKENIIEIPSILLGVKDAHNKMITIERLLGNTEIRFDRNMYGVYIPSNELLERTKYGWFNRLSLKEIQNSNTIIGELLQYKN